MSAELSEAEVRARIEGLDAETARRTVCALVGHSRIEETSFGYHYCARCSALLGDTLASVYSGAEQAVIVGHDCATCRKNAESLTWKDTLLAPDPFPVEVKV